MICSACHSDNRAEAGACFRCGAPLTSLLRRGDVVAGRYEAVAPLGRGGMGTVFRAKDRTTGEIVALKLLQADWGSHPEMARRFASEMRLASRVRHRNVCRVLDCGDDAGRKYIVTEFVDGTDLKRLLHANGALPAREAFDAAIQLARGLAAIHAAGLIHRDVKSPNVMVDRRGRFRLMDFDIAKSVFEDPAASAAGPVLGTPEYMSPEQARGETLDFRSDIYSLAVVIYEVFTGDVPFRGADATAIIRKQLRDPPPLGTPEAAAIPGSVVPVLRKALAKDKARRFGRARALAEALRVAHATAVEPQPGS